MNAPHKFPPACSPKRPTGPGGTLYRLGWSSKEEDFMRAVQTYNWGIEFFFMRIPQRDVVGGSRSRSITIEVQSDIEKSRLFSADFSSSALPGTI